MEIVKRKIYYKGMKGLLNPVVTATTLNVPIFLSQDLFNIGIYTDSKNTISDIITGFTANWDLSYDGSLQKDCRTTNKCLVTETITNVTYYNASDGSVSVNVTNQNTLDCPGPLTLNWVGPDGFTSSNLNLVNLKAGNYTLKITDGECNRTYKSYYIPQPPALDSEISVNNSQVNDTNGTCLGEATVNATGGRPPYTYAWYSAGTTTPVLGINTTLSNLCVGNYYVIITDSDGSQVTEIFNISQPPPLSGIVKSVINIDCQSTSGEIKVQGIGGYITNGYSYTLNGNTNNTGIFNSNITTPGVYNVIIADNGVSTFTLPVTITQPITPISLSFSVSNSSNDKSPATGSVSFTVQNGQSFPCPGNTSSSCYYVNLTPVIGPTPNGNNIYYGSTGAGGYTIANSTTFYGIESGWYELVASDDNCTSSDYVLVLHTFESSVSVSNYGGGKLEASVSNPSGFNWYLIQWSDGSSIPCAGALLGSPCSTTSLVSSIHTSGTEIDLEVIWVDSTSPTADTLWRSFKRKYIIP